MGKAAAVKRTPLKRRTQLQRGPGPKRRTELRRSGPLRSRGKGKGHRARQRRAEGPQHALCRRTACARCWARSLLAAGLLVVWAELPMLEPGQPQSEGHHEKSGPTRLDHETVPLCPWCHRLDADARHEGETGTAAEFWGWRRIHNGWEHVGGELPSPGDLIDEMQRRTAARTP